MSQNAEDAHHEFETVKIPLGLEAILSKMEVPTSQTIDYVPCIIQPWNNQYGRRTATVAVVAAMHTSRNTGSHSLR